MISLEQLQQLRDLVRTTVARIHTLEGENSALREKLLQYEGDLDGLSQENQDLEKNQQLVEQEIGELLCELQGLHFYDPEVSHDSSNNQKPAETMAKGEESGILQISPNDSLQSLAQRKNVNSEHVGESDHEKMQGDLLTVKEVANSSREQIEAVVLEVPAEGPAAVADYYENPTTEFSELDSESASAKLASQALATEPLIAEIAALELDEDVSHSLEISLGMRGDSLLALEENFSAMAHQEMQAEDDDLEIF